MQKILIVELADYHTEIIPMYARYLPALLHTPSLETKTYVSNLSQRLLAEMGSVTYPLAGRVVSFAAEKLGLRRKLHAHKVRQLVRRIKPDVMVFNSIEPDDVLTLFTEICAYVGLAIGIVHNPKDLNWKERPHNVQLFGLSENIFDGHSEELNGYMLPYFAHAAPPRNGRAPIPLIGVQGHVDRQRRDYDFLLQVAAELKRRNVFPCRFNIIGTLFHEILQKRVEAMGLEQYFIFHRRLSDAEFYSELVRCEFLMPLLGARHKKYFYDKISATLSHSATFKIPLLIWKQNALAWRMDIDCVLAYEGLDDLSDTLCNLPSTESLRPRYAKFVDQQIERCCMQLNSLLPSKRGLDA